MIGNRAYVHLDALRSPLHDAELVGKLLSDGGFEVAIVRDRTKAQMRAHLREFGRTLRSGDEVVFYYSGHGFAIADANYLMGIDFEAADEDEAKDNALAVQEVVDKLGAGYPRVRVIILDACRQNPYRTSTTKGPKAAGFLGEGRTAGTFYAFATALGETAEDGPADRAGPFARAVDRAFRKAPGLDIALAFRHVTDELEAIGQQPWILSSLPAGQFVILPGLVERARPMTAEEARIAAYNPHREGAASRRARSRYLDKEWSLTAGFMRIVDLPRGERAAKVERFLADYPRDNPHFEEATAAVAALRSGREPTPLAKPDPGAFASLFFPVPSWADSAPAGVALTRTEVTVGQYRACFDAGACPGEGFVTKSDGDRNYCNWDFADRRDHPMNCVSWHGAAAFCRWAQARLPKEEEWAAEASNRGTRNYPWGAEPPTCTRAIMTEADWGCGADLTWPVCSRPEGNSVSGLCDMAGNVWEWTSSRAERGRALRGGSWSHHDPEALRASARSVQEPSYQDYNVGFRCARDAAP